MNLDFWEGKSVLVTGGHGFLGKHLVELLKQTKCKLFTPSKVNYDLRNPAQMRMMMQNAIGDEIDILIHLAANVGGIGYNQEKPYDLFYENAVMGMDLIHLSLISGVKKFVQIGTACSYPSDTKMPFQESDFWNGYPEQTNAPYGIAKKMLLTQLQAARKQYRFTGIYLILSNLYGPGDNFNLETSHVIPALIRKFTEAKNKDDPYVDFWGTGSPSRDFLYAKDAVRAIVLATEKYNELKPLNIGSSRAVTIATLAEIIRDLIGYEGCVRWNNAKPNGQLRRLLNSERAKNLLGWEPEIELRDGLKETIEWYQETVLNATN